LTLSLCGIGFLFVFCFFIAILKKFYVFCLRPGRNLKKYGSWAIVTGCTDVIGKAIVEEFAKKGLNIVLISRNQQKLDDQAKELKAAFNILIKTVALDFTRSDPLMFDPVKAAIKDLDIGILVNNVGGSYDHAEYYLNLSKEKIEQLIRLNIYSTIEMTYIVLPGMVQRKRGAIINVSSASGLVNEPMYAVYSACKAFINTFSLALYYEYKGQGVHIQAQLPAFVTTKLSKLRTTSFFICSPKAYAKSFVRMIGYEPVILSYWTHYLQLKPVTFLPDWIVGPQLLARGKSVRAKAYKKKEEQALKSQ